MGNTKKKMMTAAIAGSLAAAMVVGGGTFAYLSQQTDQVTNKFKPNHALVEISESDNQYEIIPGTEQTKDPSLKADVTLDSYLYAIVTDETQGLVSYTVADGWTEIPELADGTKKVYYRKVTAAETGTSFPILKDNKVSYDKAITNDMMKDDAKLKFRGFVIQAEPFNTGENSDDEAALAAYNQTHVTATAANLATKIANAQDGQVITLEEDVTERAIDVNNGKDFELDLNGHKLEKGINVYDGNVSITNGTIDNAGGQGLMIWPNKASEPSHVTIAEDVTISGEWGITLFNADDGAAANTVVDMYGKVDGNIFVSGNLKSGDSVVNVYGTVDGGNEAGNIGIAVNGHATVNIKSGAVVTGYTGVEVRAGNLNVEEGATIRGTGAPTSFTPNGNGTTTKGAGIGVSQHTTKLPINVNVSGGTIEGYVPLYEVNPQNNSDADLAKISINVTGGTFNCINGGTTKFSIADREKITYSNSLES